MVNSLLHVSVFSLVAASTLVGAYFVYINLNSTSGRIVTIFIALIILSNCAAKLFYLCFIGKGSDIRT